jgi:hypothetical protein
MLDDPADDEGMFAGMLTPAERAALERSRVSESRPGETIDTALPEEAPSKESSGESTLDTAGKMGLSFLTVGLTLAAAAAPFFLF